jgi:hypothetical protein
LEFLPAGFGSERIRTDGKEKGKTGVFPGWFGGTRGNVPYERAKRGSYPALSTSFSIVSTRQNGLRSLYSPSENRDTLAFEVRE